MTAITFDQYPPQMKRLFKEALGYLAGSACALTVDLLILDALAHFTELPAVLAASLSFCGGMLVSYFISVRMVFRYRRIQARQLELLSFIAIGAIGLVVNAIVISIAMNIFDRRLFFSKCIAACFTFFCNFVARRQLLFVPRSMNPRIQPE